MKVTYILDGRVVAKQIHVGDSLKNLRIDTIVFESPDEIHEVLSGPGFSWMLNLANHHFDVEK